MPLVSMRLLLDHAAAHGYGVAAFNVNNMEQIQSIMEAAKATDSPVIVQASRGAQLFAGQLPAAPDARRVGTLSADSDGHAPGPRQQRGDVPVGHPERLHQRDDGRLAAGGRQDAGRLRLQRQGHSGSGEARPRPRRFGRRGTRLPRLARTWRRGAGGRPRRDRQAQPRSVADRPDRSGGVRQADRSRRAGRCHRHQPRGVQVHPQAGRRSAGDEPHRRDSQAAAEHAPRDARLRRRSRRSCRTNSASTAAT